MCAPPRSPTVCSAMPSLRASPPRSGPDRGRLRDVVVRTLRQIHRRAIHARALVDSEPASAIDVTIEIGDLVTACLEQVRGLVDELARTSPDRQALTDEIHDSLGHSLSLAAVLAGTARATIVRRPRDADEALERIVRLTSRAAAELTADSEAAPLRAVDLRSLTEQIGAVPSPPVVRIDERALADAPDRVVACVGGIVRESLTNALRHAPGAPIGVGIAARGSDLEVVVTNAAVAAPRAAGNRRGIAGMRRRAHAVGGRLHAAPTPSGEFRVHARLPMRSPSTTQKDPR